jgi:hypothetical protein
MNALVPIRSTMSRHANPAHKKAARSLGYALTLGDEAAWSGFTIVVLSGLTLKERAALAFSTLQSMAPEEAAMTATAALEGAGVGMPIAPLFSHMDEAAHWADWADPAELDAYCLASFNRMGPHRQAAFLAFVQQEVAA